MSIASGSAAPGALIDGRYTVLEHLGGGSAGEVYRVRDENFQTEVALKLLKPRAGAPPTWDEARALLRLSSEFILPVLNAAVISGVDIRYIVTDLAKGGDLSHAAAPTGAPIRTALAWGQQLASAVARVHDDGLLHRDVKPANAFLSGKGTALLADFGMAAAMDAAGTAAPDGTPVTCAPEIWAGGRCTVQTDVYSLGATLFYLLTGDWPRPGATQAQVAAAAQAGRGPAVTDLAPHVQRPVVLVVNKALALSPADRYATAADLAAALGSAGQTVARDWQRTDEHPGHRACLRGGPAGPKAGLVLCLEPGTPGRWDLRAVRDPSGRRIRGVELSGLAPAEADRALRAAVPRL